MNSYLKMEKNLKSLVRILVQLTSSKENLVTAILCVDLHASLSSLSSFVAYLLTVTPTRKKEFIESDYIRMDWNR